MKSRTSGSATWSTMKWWDDVWLNEALPRGWKKQGRRRWKPEWHLERIDVQGTTGSLNVDSLKNTRPIRQAADTPAQIQELFDGIAYGKQQPYTDARGVSGTGAFRAGSTST